MVVPLRDVFKGLYRKVNVIGVVIETTFAKKTRGKDYCCVLRINDDTHHFSGMAVSDFTVNIFARNTISLPRVYALGDIIQLCGVRILHHREVAKDEWVMFVWDGSDTQPNTIYSKLADARLSLISRRMSYLNFPKSSPITIVNHRDHATLVTLMSVLTHSEVTAIFKCVVRVIEVMAYEFENFRFSTRKYRMRMTLEDSTARIHANVDVVTLFDGYPDVQKWSRKLNRLLGISESNDFIGGEVKYYKRNPPWVCVCLKSYYLSEDDIWGTRHFRVFDITILEDS